MMDPAAWDSVLQLGRWVLVATLLALALLGALQAEGRARTLGAAGFGMQAVAALALLVYSETGLGASTPLDVVFLFVLLTSVVVPLIGLALVAVALLPTTDRP